MRAIERVKVTLSREMRKLLYMFFFLPCLLQGQITSDFESGNIDLWKQSAPDRWIADTLRPIAGNRSLRHAYDNPSQGADAISLLLSGLIPEGGDISWRFRIRHEYAPSASNNWAVFLAADRDADYMTGSSTINGVVVGVNYTGNDDFVKLWKLGKGKAEVLLETGFHWEERAGITLAPRLEVSFSTTGRWELKIDPGGTGQAFENLGFAFSPIDFSVNHFGIGYRYTQTGDLKLFFDDLFIEGEFIRDTLPPGIVYAEAVSAGCLELGFSEWIDHVSAVNTENYLLDRYLTPDSVVMTGGTACRLYFGVPFIQDQVHSLEINGVTDLTGNPVVRRLVEFVFHLPMAGDVVINEVMADPDPTIGLPVAEYTEIYNRSNFPLQMEGWTFAAGTTRKPLPAFCLQPGEYLILAGTTAATLLESFGQVLAVPGFPVLKNDGDELYLCSGDGRLISYLRYDPAWHTGRHKAEGGWSLERIDVSNPCDPCGNWTSSIHFTGGTPGQPNSVAALNPDLNPPFIERVEVAGNYQIFLVFSEPLDTVEAFNTQNYTVDHGLGNPQLAKPVFPEYKTVLLSFTDTFRRHTHYELQLGEELRDCAGNTAGYPDHLRFALPETPLAGDMVINEVLFNPWPGGVDYVEIYNRSYRVFDLGTLGLASRETGTGLLKDIRPVDKSSLIFPGEYKVLTTGPEEVCSQYPSHDKFAFVSMQRMPSYPDASGTVVLLDSFHLVMDEFSYHEDMHFPLIRDREGISLERIHYGRPAADRTNWHSASEEAGFGTPGLRNSQFSDIPAGSGVLEIEPEIFSPDNDGYHDVVTLHYFLPEPGYVASITVFDANGRMVCRLARNQLLGTEGSVSWDGTYEDGSPAGVGIYLFFTEMFDLKGNVQRYKHTCVLARRLSR